MLSREHERMRMESELTAPLPQTRIDEIEVFDASVHAVVHEHNWKVLNSMPNVANLNISVMFQCTRCKETAIREINRLDIPGYI